MKKDWSKLGFLKSLFIGSQIVVAAVLWLKPNRLLKFLRGQRQEIKELSHGDEGMRRFVADSKTLLKNLFIPSESNDHRPTILRTKSLTMFAAVAIAVKVLVTSFLFITYPSPAELSAIVSGTMVTLINESRLESGAEPLSENNSLTKFAAVKGKDMLDRNYFAHNTPEGKRPWQWIDRSEYDYVYAGENLAMDFTNAEAVHEAFMKSPSHRRNILNSNYKNVGISVLNGELGGHNTILLVQFFGSLREAVAPVAAAPTVPTPAPTPSPVVVRDEPVVAPVSSTSQPIAAGVAREDEVAFESGNEGIIVVSQRTDGRSLVAHIIEYSNIFFIAFLIFLCISLALNIFIKVHIQHPSIILQSVAVIALFAAMLLVKLHFAEQIASQLLIL